MELITQGILGAAVAQAGFQRSLGRRVALWGALLGFLPDADVIWSLLMKDPFAEILYHRGFTHSLWFAPCAAPLIGWALFRYHNKVQSEASSTVLLSWIGMSFWALITHPLLDIFTIYGTQLLTPLSSFRFYFPSIPVVEPIYSLTLLSGVVASWLLYKRPFIALATVSFCLLTTSAYLFYGLDLNDQAERVAIKNLESEGVCLTSLQAYTTFGTLYTRRVVLQTPEETRIGFVSLRGSADSQQQIQWVHMPKPSKSQNPFMEEIKKTREYAIFDWFTHHDIFYAQENSQEGEGAGKIVRLYDARFGSPANPKQSIWGIEVKLSPEGDIMENPRWFKTRIEKNLTNLKKLFGVLPQNLVQPSHEH